MGEKLGPARRQRPPRPGVLSRAWSGRSDLWRSCRPPQFARKTRSLPESLGPLPPPLRQQERLSRPEAPFIDMCVAHIRRHRPPPIPQLCRRGPASGARSPFRCSRTKGLDPPRLRGLFARGREDRTPHVDFCNQNDRWAQPPDRSNPAHPTRGRPRARLQACRLRQLSPPKSACRTGGRAPFEAPPAEMSRARGRPC